MIAPSSYSPVLGEYSFKGMEGLFYLDSALWFLLKGRYGVLGQNDIFILKNIETFV